MFPFLGVSRASFDVVASGRGAAAHLASLCLGLWLLAYKLSWEEYFPTLI